MMSQTALAQHSSPVRDSDVIRVDFVNDKLGIAATLRQAFAAASQDPSTHDFDKLLRELD